jgi:hypothetical protein
MIRPRLLLRALLAVGVLMLAGCATQPGYDYSAFRESRPRSILVLPPLNDSPDVNATYSMYAQTTLPLAESGYYVLPVTLVDEAFRQNGLTAPADIQQVPLKKLRRSSAPTRPLHQGHPLRHQIHDHLQRNPRLRRGQAGRSA